MRITTEQNKMYFYGRIWDGEASYFQREFNRISRNNTDVDIHIHSIGGSVFDGNIMWNSVANSSSNVDIYIDGLAASMSAILITAARKVYMAENAFIMIHAPSGGGKGTASQKRQTANLLEQMEINFIKKLVAKTGKPETEVKQWLIGDNWFSASQALEAGLIDGIVEAKTVELNLDDPSALSNQELTAQFVASLDFEDVFQQNRTSKPEASHTPKPTSNHFNMKQDIIDALSLTGVTAQSSDTAVISSVVAKNAELQAKLDAEIKARGNLETVIAAQKDAKVLAIVEMAIGQKKITSAQKEVYMNIGKTSGVEALETVLGGISVHKPLSAHLQSKTNASNGTVVQGMNWDKYQKEDPAGLEALMVDDPETFNALYKAKFGTEFKQD